MGHSRSDRGGTKLHARNKYKREKNKRVINDMKINGMEKRRERDGRSKGGGKGSTKAVTAESVRL